MWCRGEGHEKILKYSFLNFIKLIESFPDMSLYLLKGGGGGGGYETSNLRETCGCNRDSG